MLRSSCPAFGHASRGDQYVFRYVLEYVAAEHAVFPPYKCVSCRALIRWRLILRARTRAVAVAQQGAFAGLANLISGGESGGGARPLNPQWVRDIIADCRREGVAPFHKQWGTYPNNPLVLEDGMSIADAKAMDKFGKGGG